MGYAADSFERRRGERMANLKRLIFWTSFALVAAACIGASYYVRYSAERRGSTEASIARDEALRIQQQVVLFTKRFVPSGRPFSVFLHGLGIDSPTTARLAAAAQPVFDLRHLRAGNELDVGRSVLGDLREVRYSIDVFG